MKKLSKVTTILLRLGMGVIFFYAGITKVANPDWSAAGYLNNAKSLEGLYAFFASPANIGWVDFLNQWGLTLIGLSLILGLFVRFSTIAGAFMMLLYYFPILEFPHAGDHSYIVDDHIIYALVLLLLFAKNAGKTLGLDMYIGRKK